MSIFNVISAILLYLLIVIIIFYPVKLRASKIKISDSKNTIISTFGIFLASVLFSWFNKYVSFGKTISGGDRMNYLQDFYGRLTGYIGFDTFLKIAHRLTDNFYYVLYAVTFICCFTVLYAVKVSFDSTPGSLFILLCTPFILDTFSGLKQVFACALAAIMFSEFSKPVSIKRDVMCIISIVFACLFHTSGYLLIPIFLILRFYKNINFKITIVSLIAIAFFFTTGFAFCC